jgi:hypothetical protein
MPYQDPVAQREYQRQWVASRRAAWFAGKTCSWCGSSERLELHHADPAKKVSHAIWSWGENRRLNEIGKCIVLCRPCHEKGHAEARRVEAELRNPCGTYASYKRGCRCDSCRAANREYLRAARAA